MRDINHFHLNCWIRQHRPAGSLCCAGDWRLQWQGLWRKWKTVDSAAVGGRVFSQAITGIWLLCGDASLVTSWKWQSSPGEPHDNMCCQTTLSPQYRNQLWMYGGFYHLSDFVSRSTVMTEIEVEIHPACDTKCWVDVRLDRGNIAHYIQFTNHAQKMSQMWLWLAPWRSGELDLAGDWLEIIKIKILFFLFLWENLQAVSANFKTKFSIRVVQKCPNNFVLKLLQKIHSAIHCIVISFKLKYRFGQIVITEEDIKRHPLPRTRARLEQRQKVYLSYDTIYTLSEFIPPV